MRPDVRGDIYVPPNIRSQQLEELRKAVATEVASLKVSYNDPLIFVAGDFNHKDFAGALAKVDDNTIDLVFSNTSEDVKGNTILPPLQANTGAVSDHRCLYNATQFRECRKFRWVVRYRRTRNQARDEAFAEDLQNWEWGTSIGADQEVNAMTSAMEEAISKLTEKHFPLARVRKRSNEAPWVTRHIRRLWKRKLRLYKDGGRCDRWWDTDRQLQQRIAESREAFVERMLEEGNSSRSFYAATRKLASAAAAPQWGVKDLFPGEDPKTVCQEVLNYFGNISNGEVAEIPDVPRCPGGLEELSFEKTAELLQAAKKTDSYVAGDPHLVRCQPTAFATPITAIYNRINLLPLYNGMPQTETIQS